MNRLAENSPEYQGALAAKNEVNARWQAAREARADVMNRWNVLGARRSMLKRWVPQVTMAVANLSSEVETASSPSFEGWSITGDSPEVRQELTDAIAAGEKSASVDAAAERRVVQQAGAAASAAESSSGRGARMAGLGLLGTSAGLASSSRRHQAERRAPMAMARAAARWGRRVFLCLAQGRQGLTPDANANTSHSLSQ
jgi:hypothetical protein